MILRISTSLAFLFSIFCTSFLYSDQSNTIEKGLSIDCQKQFECCFKPKHRYWVSKKKRCKGKRGPTGPTGATGPTGTTGATGTFSSSYGQLISLNDEPIIDFTAADTWIPVPFNQAISSSDIEVTTTSPATISVQQPAVYQLSVSLHFSAEEAQETGFTETTYTLGVKVGNTTLPVASVYASNPGEQSLNYSTLTELSEGEEIQVYIQASALNIGPPFDNIVSLVNASAYLLKVAD